MNPMLQSYIFFNQTNDGDFFLRKFFFPDSAKMDSENKKIFSEKKKMSSEKIFHEFDSVILMPETKRGRYETFLFFAIFKLSRQDSNLK